MIANDNDFSLSLAAVRHMRRPALRMLRIGGIVYPVGILFKSQWAILKTCWEARGNGTATPDQAWPFRGLIYLLQAADPKFDVMSVNLADITAEHLLAAHSEIERQVLWGAFHECATPTSIR